MSQTFCRGLQFYLHDNSEDVQFMAANYLLLIVHKYIITILINPRLTGGGAFDAPLPNIRDSSKTNSAIDVKLGRPSHTTI